MSSAVIVIPARIGSTRLPSKPLKDINEKTMIMHVVEKALLANVGDVIVATDDEAICKEVQKNDKCKCIITDSDIDSGTARIGHALTQYKDDCEFVINLQGDVPNADPETIVNTLNALKETPEADIMTPVVCANDMDEINKPQNVKVALRKIDDKVARSIYFSRSVIPYNTKQHYIHIGIYVYRKTALEKFISLPQTVIETEESLEQLKALSYGMSIYTYETNHKPISIDTPEDLELARKMIF
jgi:3-deoxy-manno-octulosonate cytidylyltransferase (CMP-KDO synthetase)